ncbi:N-acetylmuramoyl-L-alanine amidase [Candidatus Babeliales bacterium]|nr:N-acetylmuramoyl-L-alanine amidase [Candidatus Babeliales bacterium]
MIKKVTLFLLTLTLFGQTHGRAVIMLDPAGDAHELGRKLAQGYERGATLTLAEKLQQELMQEPEVYPLLSRQPGEQCLPLQAASFANRLNVNLFVRLHCYHELTAKPRIYLYYQLRNPLTDLATRSFNPLSFTPLSQAHLPNLRLTLKRIESMKETLKNQQYQQLFDCFGPYGLPLKPLAGVQPAGLIIEIGLSSSTKLESLIKPIKQALINTCLIF